MATDKKISELPIVAGLTADDVSVIVQGGTDYQFNLDQLLGFVSSNIYAGANVTFGTTLPQNNSGKNGDVFVNTQTGAMYQKINAVWVSTYTPASGGVTGNTTIFASGIPATGIGANGDSYVNVDTGIFYKKSNGVWLQVFSMASGPQGPRGSAILSGAVDPLSSVGLNGDFYFNTATLTIFGPKISGIWPAGITIKGEAANALLYGTGNPSNSIGKNGDFFLNTTTYTLYGPKADNDWPQGVSLIYQPAQAITIGIPEGSPIPFIIAYSTEYSEYGNDPVVLVEMVAANNIRRSVNDVLVEKRYSAGSLNTLHIYGHDSGNGSTTIDDLIITIK
ncbi:hypothetical protein LJ707_12725 [Mucilaginibacter sp. UR6-1]|uniref:hypothetical protein n=1 Tax=Mucilaginibacter sp. UR6-1 TaxID=1435643 RepID=UPI001E5AF1E1|nr:hypothetical protein [Mucilaginibacter sp. UR6-1]MCC8409796.1 hypothetical protein [Mucilaginibacter sp. UR6-1]